MPDNDQVYKGCATEKDRVDVAKMAGLEGINTLRAACQAQQEGRYGYEALMGAKLTFHDVPVHQFSSGETLKPAATPSTTPSTKGQEAPVQRK